MLFNTDMAQNFNKCIKQQNEIYGNTKHVVSS